jgi:hypothetical protein
VRKMEVNLVYLKGSLLISWKKIDKDRWHSGYAGKICGEDYE